MKKTETDDGVTLVTGGANEMRAYKGRVGVTFRKVPRFEGMEVTCWIHMPDRRHDLHLSKADLYNLADAIDVLLDEMERRGL